ncbi:DUF397 domain-containing protein [Spirillospora sp. NPDC047418]
MGNVMAWRKSSYSHGGGTTDCVELAALEPHVGIRDSKDPSASHLVIAKEQLADLVDRIKVGDCDLR